MSDNSIVICRGASKVYGGLSGNVQALHDVTFQVEEGEFVSVIGPSGCGKTTLLKLLSGLIFCTEGQVLVEGDPVSAPVQDASMVFQTPVLLDWRSILENVLLPIEILGGNKDEYSERAKELLDLVDVLDFRHKYPWELSIGMQQRVSLCRALIHEPSLLLMDEPFGGLDALTRDEVDLELLKVWRKTQKTIVFVTHSIEEAVLLSDRAIVLTPRPASVEKIIPVELDRPRTLNVKDDPKYRKLCSKVRSNLAL